MLSIQLVAYEAHQNIQFKSIRFELRRPRLLRSSGLWRRAVLHEVTSVSEKRILSIPKFEVSHEVPPASFTSSLKSSVMLYQRFSETLVTTYKTTNCHCSRTQQPKFLPVPQSQSKAAKLLLWHRCGSGRKLDRITYLSMHMGLSHCQSTVMWA
jgi:hypothetical protein